MSVRAKFKVQSITLDMSDSRTVKLHAVTGNGEEDDPNADWSKWTPSGEISMHITNPAAFEQFKVGTEFYVDFTEAPIEG